MSKVNGATHAMRSSAVQPNREAPASSRLARLPCSTITAFGVPVVPEV